MTSTSIRSSTRQGLFDLWLFFCVRGLKGHHKPFWKHHAKLATFAGQKEHTTTLILYCVWVP